MTLLDRYIIRQYLTNALALLLILCAFAVAIDVSLNFGDFWDIARRILQSEGTPKPGAIQLSCKALYLVFDFWWPNLLRLFNFMLGLVMVGAMGFTLSQLVRNRELVATLSSGISLQRIGRPILLTGLLLSSVQLLNRELVMPRIAPLLAREREAAGQKFLGAASVPLTADGRGRLFYAKSFDADRGLLEGLVVYERDTDGSLRRRISAEKATWDAAQGQWVLQGGKVDRALSVLSSDEPIAAIQTPLDPTQLKLRRFAGYSQSLGFWQLTQLAHSPDLLDESTRKRLEELDRVRFGRFATVGANLLTLIISLSFYLRREPTNMWRQTLKCAPVAMISLFGGILASNIAIPAVPAWLGVFLPCVILAPIAVAAVRSIRT